jgi:EF-hand domain
VGEEFNVQSKFTKGAKPEGSGDGEFEDAWFSQFRGGEGTKKMNPVAQNIEDIKQFAYSAFDILDKNGNGFIESTELVAALEDPAVGMREKSFITFLLTNHAEIADAVKEGVPEHTEGISRLDLELYFRLLLSRVQ